MDKHLKQLQDAVNLKNCKYQIKKDEASWIELCKAVSKLDEEKGKSNANK